MKFPSPIKNKILLPCSLTTLLFFGITSCSNSTTPSSTNLWQLVGSSLTVPNVILKALVITNNGTIYNGGSVDVYNGVILSTTAATPGNWQISGNGYIPNPATSDGSSNIIQVSSIGISNNIVYAAANINYEAGYVYSNAGNSWNKIANGQPIPNSGIVNSIAVDGNNIVYAATSGYSLSANTYIGNVYGCSNGGNWQQIGGGSLPDGGGANSVILANGMLYVASGSPNVNLSNSYVGDVYSSSFTGSNWQNWQQIGGGSLPDSGTANALAAESNGGIVYVATSKGNVYSSGTSGSWNLIGGMPVPDRGAINAITLSSANGKIYSATSKGNVYSATKSSNWQLVGGGAMPDGWFINAIAVYLNRVYVVTQGGNTYSTPI